MLLTIESTDTALIDKLTGLASHLGVRVVSHIVLDREKDPDQVVMFGTSADCNDYILAKGNPIFLGKDRYVVRPFQLSLGKTPDFNIIPVLDTGGQHEVVDLTDDSIPCVGSFKECEEYIAGRDLSVFKLADGQPRFTIRKINLPTFEQGLQALQMAAGPHYNDFAETVSSVIGLDHSAKTPSINAVFLPEDHELAAAEGWDVFDEDGVYGIEKDDDADVFETDGDAFSHVLRRAGEGNLTALRALFVDGRTDENINGLAPSFIKLLFPMEEPRDPNAGSPRDQIIETIINFSVHGPSVTVTDNRTGAEILADQILKLFGPRTEFAPTSPKNPSLPHPMPWKAGRSPGTLIPHVYDMNGKEVTPETIVGEIERLIDGIGVILDKAHVHSSGPTVPDGYWEIRQLAITLV